MIVAVNLEQRCWCGFTQDHLINPFFQCFTTFLQGVTYCAILHGTAYITSSELTEHIGQWDFGGYEIPVQNILLRVDSSCVSNNIISSNNDDG